MNRDGNIFCFFQVIGITTMRSGDDLNFIEALTKLFMTR